MKYLIAIVVFVLEAIEDSPVWFIVLGWFFGLLVGMGSLQGKIHEPGIWGLVLSVVCGFAGWCVCWLCRQAIKLIYRYHRPESPLLKKKKRNVCPACGYDLSGLPQTSHGPAPCPECGKS